MKRAFDSHPPVLKIPEQLPGSGILVGWSLEEVHRRQPIGFSFGETSKSPRTGYIDPVLFEGDGHLITIAPTGAGKGVSCLIPTLLRYPGPTIVIDPKGENMAVTARRRRELGDKVFVLDPMGVTDSEGDRLNPLDLVQCESDTGVDDAFSLAQFIFPDTKEVRDGFWRNRALQLIAGIILHIVTDLSPKERSLATLRKLVLSTAGNTGTLVSALKNSRHPEANLIVNNLAIGSPETLGGILAFAQEGVDFIRGPLVQKATQDSTIDLGSVTAGDPLSIFIVLPPHMLESHGRLLRLWIGCLMTAIMRRRGRPKRSTLFLLDEVAQLGTLASLRQAITLLRGYGLQTWSFWQDASQLRNLYPYDWQTMLNNSQVVQCFGANNMLAAKEMADLVGFGDGQAVLDLTPDEMLLQIGGDEAVLGKRPDYRSDAPFKGFFDQNPYFDTRRGPVRSPRSTVLMYLRDPSPKRIEAQIISAGLEETEEDRKLFDRIRQAANCASDP
jgi:type IV secretion system protein VirD4